MIYALIEVSDEETYNQGLPLGTLGLYLALGLLGTELTLLAKYPNKATHPLGHAPSHGAGPCSTCLHARQPRTQLLARTPGRRVRVPPHPARSVLKRTGERAAPPFRVKQQHFCEAVGWGRGPSLGRGRGALGLSLQGDARQVQAGGDDYAADC